MTDTAPAPPTLPAGARAALAEALGGDQAIRDAVHTVVDLRVFGPGWLVQELTALSRTDPYRFVTMTIALAAMVPIDKGVDVLVAWLQEAPPMPRPAQPDA